MAKKKVNKKFEEHELEDFSQAPETKKQYRNVGNKKAPVRTILFDKTNYIIIGVGLLLVVIGFFLMAGGAQVSPDEWSEEVYSFRRITIAPMVILAGLGVVIFAIFKTPAEAIIEDDVVIQ